MQPEVRLDFLKSLNKQEQHYLNSNPLSLLNTVQLAPIGDWRYHWFRAARGVGKTFSSTAWLVDKIILGAEEVALVGPSHRDLHKDIVPVLLKHLLRVFDYKQINYNASTGIIKMPKSVIKLFSSEYEIRGCNAQFAVDEELMKWADKQPDKVKERFDTFDLAVRGTEYPQHFISSTPAAYPIFMELEDKALSKDPLYSMTIATIDDATFLSEQHRNSQKNKLMSSRMGRQELYAELLRDIPGALWSYELIEQHTLTQPPLDINGNPVIFDKITISVDPAVTSTSKSDETGIIIVGRYNRKYYVLQDASGKYSPLEWANKVNQLYQQYRANYVIAEVNQGYDLVKTNLLSVNPRLPIKEVRASKGKILRAEPVLALYERGLVKHIHTFPQLEKQMTSYTGSSDVSPDRLDALVYGLTDLGLNLNYSNIQGLHNLPQYR